MFVLLHPCLGMRSFFHCIVLCFLEGFTCLEKLPHFHALNQRTEIWQGADLEMHFLLFFWKIKTQCIHLVKVQAFGIPSHTHILPCASYTMHSVLCNLHPALCILHLHLVPHTMHPIPCTLHCASHTQHLTPYMGPLSHITKPAVLCSMAQPLFPFSCSHSHATQLLHENLLHLRQLSHLRKKHSGSRCLPPLASKFRVS